MCSNSDVHEVCGMTTSTVGFTPYIRFCGVLCALASLRETCSPAGDASKSVSPFRLPPMPTTDAAQALGAATRRVGTHPLTSPTRSTTTAPSANLCRNPNRRS